MIYLKNNCMIIYFLIIILNYFVPPIPNLLMLLDSIQSSFLNCNFLLIHHLILSS